MKLRTCLKAIKIKFKQVRDKQRRRMSVPLAASYVSLFLVLTLIITSTAAWFTMYDKATITSQNFALESSSSLRVNKGKQVSNRIVLEDFVLDEASSLDGRNIYFPLSGTFNEETADMLFREGTVGDENVRYVYEDFQLTGTAGITYVYVKSYDIKIGEPGQTKYGEYKDQLQITYENGVPKNQTIPPDCPLRIAFISDSAAAPVVIDPSAIVDNHVENSNAVSSTREDGSPRTTWTSTRSFSSYYFRTGSPIFALNGSDPVTVTMVVWLEGTVGNCEDYIGKNISIDIDIESNFVEMETVAFVDGTAGDDGTGDHWVSNDDPIIVMSYKDPYSTEGRYKLVVMDKVEEHKWQAPLPKKALDNISFYRLSKKGATDAPLGEGSVYNSWHTYSGVNDQLNSAIPSDWYRSNKKDLQESRIVTVNGVETRSLVYTATHGNKHSVTTDVANRLSPCIGYWSYGESQEQTSTTSSGGDSGGGSGGGGSSTTYTVGIACNTGDKPWIETNANNGDQLWVHFSDDSHYQLRHAGSNRFENNNITVARDVSIDYFYMTNSSGTGYTNISVSKEVTITKNYNYTYNINNDQIFVPNV